MSLCPTGGHLAKSGDTLLRGREVLLVSRGCLRGIQVTVLPCPGHPHSREGSGPSVCSAGVRLPQGGGGWGMDNYLEKLPHPIQAAGMGSCRRGHLLKASLELHLRRALCPHRSCSRGRHLHETVQREGLSLCLDWLPRGQSWSLGLIWGPLEGTGGHIPTLAPPLGD